MTKKNTVGAPRRSESSEKAKRRRVKVKTGQIVAVPLRDGTFGLGHVAQYTYLQAILAHFDHRAKHAADLIEGAEEAMKHRLLTILAVTSDEIYDGHWPVIGHKEPTYPAALLDMKGTSHTGNVSRWFFDAYYGLVPWDAMAATPRYFENMLLAGVPVPPTARYKRDFEKGAETAVGTTPGGAAVEASPVTDSEQVAMNTEGAGVVHIAIKYDGDGLPSIPLLKRRQAIEDALESAGVGEVTDAGGGGGIMDIYLETKDMSHAMPFVHAAIKEVGFEKDARIEVEPMSDDDSEEQDDH